MNPPRVLILADESAHWIVAGLRQLDRIALAINEFAIQNGAVGPVPIHVWWQPDIDQTLRWVPADPRLTMVAFSSESRPGPHDLVLTTRLFLYRKSIAPYLANVGASDTPSGSWEDCARAANPPAPSLDGVWVQLEDERQIAAAEARFLRGSGKSQDGLVSRHLNRPISRAVTRLLLRLSVTPNAWTWLISPLPLLAALVMCRGTYVSFLVGMILFQIFSILDGCDGEIARATFMESERGRQLDDLFDVLSNVLLVLGLGIGLQQAAHGGWYYVVEGFVAAALIVFSEWHLTSRKPAETSPEISDAFGGSLYPRHRQMIQRSGLLRFGEKFAAALMQLTKRDVAVLFFVFLAAIGFPGAILHLLFTVAAVTLVFALL